jgi:hypothetical protein
MSLITFMLEDEHKLSLGMLMHVKCIHDLCSLLGHILIYLIIIKELDMFFTESGGFLNNSLSFGFSSQRQPFLFVLVFYFQDLPDVT